MGKLTEGKSLEELFHLLREKLDKIEDWRDLFQYLHNWGYNTDFTYNNITDPDKTTVTEYVAAYIEDVYGEEDKA